MEIRPAGSFADEEKDCLSNTKSFAVMVKLASHTFDERKGHGS
jgi:hypothetical protein